MSSGHVLVVPRRHIARLERLDREEWAAVFDLVHQIARDVVGARGVDGVNIGLTSGAAAARPSSTAMST